MSLIKSAQRRLSLLAGSSLAAASIASVAALATLSVPTAAFAYDECLPVAGTGTLSDGPGGQHDATMNGNAADTFRCANFTTANITYNSVGTTGLLTVDMTSNNPGGGFSQSAGTLSGLTLTPGGSAVVNVGPNANVVATQGAATGFRPTILSGTTTTLNIFDNDTPTTGDDITAEGNVQHIRATGAGNLVVNNDGVISGNIELQNLTGTSTFNITGEGAWYLGTSLYSSQFGSFFAMPSGATLFAAGNDQVNISEGGVVFAGFKPTDGVNLIRTLDFRETSGDLDVFTNNGVLAINHFGLASQTNSRFDSFSGTVIMSGLEEFRGTGTVFLGSAQRAQSGDDVGADEVETDGWYDDVLSLPGTRWVGEGGELVMNVDLMRSQSDCTTRNASGDLGAADCVMLLNGTTEGVTNITLIDLIPGDRGRYNPDGILLVDVTGSGASGAGHFVIGPNTNGYSPEFGGVMDKGLFFYAIAYNEENQEHILYGLPGANAYQFPLLVSAAQSLWRTSTGSWLERQADLRGQQEDGPGGGVWLRVSGENTDRDVLQTETIAGQSYTFDNTLKQESYAVTGGADLLVGNGANSAWVLGVTAGYAHADVTYDMSPNTGRLDGWTAGVYASLIVGGFFLDAVVNVNKLTLDDDVPALDLFPTGTILSTDVVSRGGQVEIGYRFDFEDGLFIEPLAGVSYVDIKLEDILIPADDPARPRIAIQYDDPDSLRGSLGVRSGWDYDHGSFRTQLSVLGRAVEEIHGENRVTLLNEGPDVLLTDDVSGRFHELVLGGSIYSAGGAVSGFANFGGKFGEDYKARTLSAGVRVAF